MFSGNLVALVSLVAALALPAIAQDFDGFAKFLKEPINAPGSYKIIADPTGSAPTAKVHRFTITAGACSAKAHGNGLSDCSFNSIRSQAYEGNKKQPADAWYGWYMYVPGDFPLGKAQRAGGTYSFAYWHNLECPNLDIGVAENSTRLFLQTNWFDGPGSCTPDQRITLGNLAALLGGWHQFEVHIRWSQGSDGFAHVYIDGRQAGTIAGRNITKGAPAKNYFKFGIYLHGTRGSDLVAPATAYFAGLARAARREDLSK